MRLYDNRFYVLGRHPGISGFQDWSRLECSIVTGRKAKQNRGSILGELLPIAEDYYRLGDGKMPDYQPRLRTPDALAWLTANPFCEIVRLDPATLTKDMPAHYKTWGRTQ